MVAVEAHGACQDARSMGRFRTDPDFVLRWPSDLLAGELAALIERGRTDGTGPTWKEDVQRVLTQAFASREPARQFDEVYRPTAEPAPAGYNLDDEPF
jgi:hypothetical protein